MRTNHIIICGYKFSKQELQELFDAYAATSPLDSRKEAWLVAEAIDALEEKQLAQVCLELQKLREVRTLKARYDGMRHTKTSSLNLTRSSAEEADARASALIRALAAALGVM